MALRLLEIILPETNEEQARKLLEEQSVMGLWQDHVSDTLLLLRVLTSAEMTETVMDALEKRFSGVEEFRLILLPVEASVPRPPPEPVDHEGKDSPDKGDQYNGRIVRVSNGSVFKDPVFNYSADFPFLWDESMVPVRFGSDPALARRILEDILAEVIGEYAAYARAAWVQTVKKYKIEDARVEPKVTLVANENWMEFTLRYVVDYKERRTRKDRIFTRILEEFEKSGGQVEIASTSTDISLVKTPVFDIKISDSK